MTTTSSVITVIEDFGKNSKDEPVVFRSQPDFHNPVMPEVAEFISKANKALRDFREAWAKEHEDTWAASLEMDVVPVLSDGMIMGYMVVSESGDGFAYDYVPTKRVDENGESQ